MLNGALSNTLFYMPESQTINQENISNRSLKNIKKNEIINSLK